MATKGHSRPDGTEINQPFVTTLVEARRAAGMSQQQLADRIGIGQAAVGFWEKNPTSPKPHHLFAAETALGLPAGALSMHWGYMPAAADPLAMSIMASERHSAERKKMLLQLVDDLADLD